MTGMATINEIVLRVKKHRPLSVYLFGSYAYGTPNEDSDIDLMIISSEPSKDYYQRIMSDMWDIEQSMDVLVFSVDSIKEKMTWNPMINKILKDGKVLYGKSIR